MAIMERDLLIKIRCGKDTCGVCDFLDAGEDEAGFCRLSQILWGDGEASKIDDEHHRLRPCLEAVDAAEELKIRCLTKSIVPEAKPAEAPAVSAEEHGD